MQSTIEDALYRAVRKVKPSLTNEPLSSKTKFDDYYITSLEMAMIVFELEDEFDVIIGGHTLIDFVTLGDACRFIQGLIEQRQDVVANEQVG